MKWFVYILFCDRKTFYVGFTDNLERRFSEHKNKYSNYTKKFSDLELIYFEKFSSSEKAKNREKQLKGWTRAKKMALINNNKDLLIELSKGTRLGDVESVD